MKPRSLRVLFVVSALVAALIVCGLAAGSGALLWSQPAPTRLVTQSQPPSAGTAGRRSSTTGSRTHSRGDAGTHASGAVSPSRPGGSALAGEGRSSWLWPWLLLFVVLGVLLALRRFLAIAMRRRRSHAPTGTTVVHVGADVRADEPGQDGEVWNEAPAPLPEPDRASDPRSAVLACWLQLEDLIARDLAARAPSETSAELVERVVAQQSVDPATLIVLQHAYESARYSTRPVEEGTAEIARRALTSVKAQLAAQALTDHALAAGV